MKHLCSAYRSQWSCQECFYSVDLHHFHPWIFTFSWLTFLKFTSALAKMVEHKILYLPSFPALSFSSIHWIETIYLCTKSLTMSPALVKCSNHRLSIVKVHEWITRFDPLFNSIMKIKMVKFWLILWTLIFCATGRKLKREMLVPWAWQVTKNSSPPALQLCSVSGSSRISLWRFLRINKTSFVLCSFFDKSIQIFAKINLKVRLNFHFLLSAQCPHKLRIFPVLKAS